MSTTNFKLLATSPTLEGINKLINKFFYSDIEIKENENILTGNKSKFLDVYNKNGKINGYVVMRDKRYKFLEKH